MLSKKGKFMMLMLLLATSNMMYSQRNEMGILTNIGISKFHNKEIIRSHRIIVGVMPKYSESYEGGAYYRKTFNNKTFFKLELSYNRLKEKHIARNQRITERGIISSNPIEYGWIDIGEITEAREIRNHNAINFPVYFGFHRKKLLFELGFGGSLVWATNRSITVNEVIRGEEKSQGSISNDNDSPKTRRLFRVNTGYVLSEKTKLKLNGYWTTEKGEPNSLRYYTEFSIGLAYQLLNRKARW
ncbi:MAG: hypothetical protein R2828_34930 [Saprospiraceae bacterium]